MKLTKLNAIALSLGIMMSVSSVSFAQEKQQLSSKDIAKKKTEMMKEKLDLTKKQYKKVYDINLEYIEAKKAGMSQRPTLPKGGKHFKGGVCQPNPEKPCAVECEKPKKDCMNVCPNGKPQMKGDCKNPCPDKMKANCPKMNAGKCNMKANCPMGKDSCKQIKPCMKKVPKSPMDSISRAYNTKIKDVLTAAQYEKWIKMQVNCKKGHKGCKPMPCPKK